MTTNDVPASNQSALMWQVFFAGAMFVSTFLSYLLPILIVMRRNRRLNNQFTGSVSENGHQHGDMPSHNHWSELNQINAITEQKKAQLKRILSYCNCVSAGVFLGVCFLNLIPTVEKEFSNLVRDYDVLKKWFGSMPLGLFSTVCGLFLVLILECLLSTWFKPNIQPEHSHQDLSTVPILYLEDESVRQMCLFKTSFDFLF